MTEWEVDMKDFVEAGGVAVRDENGWLVARCPVYKLAYRVVALQKLAVFCESLLSDLRQEVIYREDVEKLTQLLSDAGGK